MGKLGHPRTGIYPWGGTRDQIRYFCDCETPQPDGLYQCETCYRLVYRDDY